MCIYEYSIALHLYGCKYNTKYIRQNVYFGQPIVMKQEANAVFRNVSIKYLRNLLHVMNMIFVILTDYLVKLRNKGTYYTIIPTTYRL